ncbi:hypothetical protein GA0070616_3424 [Micromonospora nigra]|uniref:Uncharacterized protein n=1 Tax=Micromonospora nigra TaxID=145857 RepID=A0A1C6SC65_9ACTN|nr:hypothetical protein [Micromonospora nigra]SCL27047.1 hypothetical protein GA0070616_3424 [Micromonospora nigra]
MTSVTGRRAAPDHEGGPFPTDGCPDPARSGAVAPHPRAVPAPPGQPPDAAGPATRVEPTTGAPVDALPRRVPLRVRRDRGGEVGTPDDDGGVFWAPIEEVHWDGTPVREETRTGTDRWRRWLPRRVRPRRATHPPEPVRGLAALLALSLAGAFFSWVSAEPFWIAVGHARPGTVVVLDCSGGGLTQRCRGIFRAADDGFLAHGVRVSGVPGDRAVPGARLAARMTGPDGGTAYADDGAGAHLRWLLGLLAVVGCGVGVARATGATRLPDPRHRRWAVGVAVTAPLLITAGFLAAAW